MIEKTQQFFFEQSMSQSSDYKFSDLIETFPCALKTDQ